MSVTKMLLVCALFCALVRSEKWAVLVAGSNTWANYRHQADILHAYQMLIKDKFPANRIITMLFDDIASNIKNKFKGKVFNKPTYKDPGVDVYGGVAIDYSKKDVTPQVFLAVLEGDKGAVRGRGTGRVLQATASDNVFVFFSDHGAPGLLAFPSQYLYADALLNTFVKMRGRYNKLVFYVQACESGSLFVKLPTDMRIYAVTAASPTQSSWATYCTPNDVIQGQHIGTCLGDLFSVTFIEETQLGLFYRESLNDQFKIMQSKTNASHVMQWGDMSFVSDKVGDFIAGPPPSRLFKRVKGSRLLNSRTIKIELLVAEYVREGTGSAFDEMQEEMLSMRVLDNTFAQLRNRLQLKGQYDPQKIAFDCLREVMEYHQRKCGRLSDYGLGFVKYFAEACEIYTVREIEIEINC